MLFYRWYVCDVFLLLTLVSMVLMQGNPSVMRFRISKLKGGSICFGSCTSTFSQFPYMWRLGGGLVPT